VVVVVVAVVVVYFNSNFKGKYWAIVPKMSGKYVHPVNRETTA
jgi:hypothetical protein